jgi:hypothetical protein
LDEEFINGGSFLRFLFVPIVPPVKVNKDWRKNEDRLREFGYLKK